MLCAVSACFGESGAWRCANGTPCAFTAGVGYHCPDVSSSRCPRSAAAKPMDGSCSRCRSQASAKVTVRFSGPCASVCRACQCRFVVTTLRAPVVTPHTSSITITMTTEHPAVFPSDAAPTVGFTVRPVIFTTGPPDLLRTVPSAAAPSRAPPRLLSA
jgi:hypothetical protein